MLYLSKNQPQMSSWVITTKFHSLFMRGVYHSLAETSAHCSCSDSQANGAATVSNTGHHVRGKMALEGLVLVTTWFRRKQHISPPLTTHSTELVPWLHAISGGQGVPSYHVPKVRAPEIVGQQHQWPLQPWQWSSRQNRTSSHFSKPLPRHHQTSTTKCLRTCYVPGSALLNSRHLSQYFVVFPVLSFSAYHLPTGRQFRT